MRRLSGALVCLVLAAAWPARAQELEPKAYSASPVGANFLVAGLSWSSGGVVFDPTLPITDVQATLEALAVGGGHTFNLFGALALATFAVPIAWVDATGKVADQAGEITRSGLADLRFKLSVNLRGNPAMTPTEFAKAPRRTVVGASVETTAPAGQYDAAKLINLGTNRWSFKPEVGVSWPKGRWDIDAYLGMWFYTANSSFYPGTRTRTQDPVLTIQGHASYTLRPRFWLALDGTWYRGGSTRLDDNNPSVALNNSRLGVTTSVPFGQRYSLKLAYNSGVVVRTGSNFKTLAIAWQTLWLNSRWSGR